MKIGDNSPWGPIQSIHNYGPILHITTAGHGGFYVPASLYKEIPNYAKNTEYSSGGFYEEDCDWSIPVCIFPEYFDIKTQDVAKRVLHSYHKDIAIKLGITL